MPAKITLNRLAGAHAISESSSGIGYRNGVGAGVDDEDVVTGLDPARPVGHAHRSPFAVVGGEEMATTFLVHPQEDLVMEADAGGLPRAVTHLRFGAQLEPGDAREIGRRLGTRAAGCQKRESQNEPYLSTDIAGCNPRLP